MSRCKRCGFAVILCGSIGPNRLFKCTTCRSFWPVVLYTAPNSHP